MNSLPFEEEIMNEDAQTLRDIYYNPNHPASYGGAARLSRASGIPLKKVEEWLRGQQSYTLHRPARKAGYKTRPYRTGGIDEQWQADLVDMQVEAKYNDGYKYILTVIDIFSRYGWAQPIKSKSPQHVKIGFDKIFNTSNRKPLKMQTDQGLEFESNIMREYFSNLNIHQFSVKSQFKAAIVERFNRTIKEKMWNLFTHQNTRKWLNILPMLVSGYNRNINRGIDMAPADVNEENEIPLWTKMEDKDQEVKVKKSKIKVGDSVRISKAKSIFEKGYLPRWTEEVFTVVKIIESKPRQYKLVDYDKEVVDGSFYTEELQVVDKPDVFRVEKVLQTRKARGGKKEYFVKWLGYPKKFNSWVGEDAVQGLGGR